MFYHARLQQEQNEHVTLVKHEDSIEDFLNWLRQSNVEERQAPLRRNLRFA